MEEVYVKNEKLVVTIEIAPRLRDDVWDHDFFHDDMRKLRKRSCADASNRFDNPPSASCLVVGTRRICQYTLRWSFLWFSLV